MKSKLKDYLISLHSTWKERLKNHAMRLQELHVAYHQQLFDESSGQNGPDETSKESRHNETIETIEPSVDDAEYIDRKLGYNTTVPLWASERSRLSAWTLFAEDPDRYVAVPAYKGEMFGWLVLGSFRGDPN